MCTCIVNVFCLIAIVIYNLMTSFHSTAWIALQKRLLNKGCFVASFILSHHRGILVGTQGEVADTTLP
jgi:hypothetical protein